MAPFSFAHPWSIHPCYQPTWTKLKYLKYVSIFYICLFNPRSHGLFMIYDRKKKKFFHVASTRLVIRLSSCPPWWGDPDLSWYPRRARCIGTALVPALRPVEMVEIGRNMSHAGIGVLRANQSLHPDFTALELLRKSSKKSKNSIPSTIPYLRQTMQSQGCKGLGIVRFRFLAITVTTLKVSQWAPSSPMETINGWCKSYNHL